MADNAIELSKRQHQVLELLLQGKSNKEIALELGISESTVEFHLRNIYGKLQVRSRTEAILKLGQSTGTTRGELRESLVAHPMENKHNGGRFIQELKMKNRLFYYFLAGLIFGAVYWFYGSAANVLNELPLPEHDYWQIWFSLSITVVVDYGVWLVPATLPAIVEYRHSQRVNLSTAATMIVWVSAGIGYCLSYIVMLAMIGLPQMEYLLIFNEHSTDFWQNWWAIFRTLIFSQFLEFTIIGLFIGGVTGLVSAMLYSYWVRKTNTILSTQP